MNELELDISDDTMRFYWDWIRSYFRIGNKPDCKQETGGVRINCPFRRRKDKKKAEKFEKDTMFPLPSGPLWQEYVTMRTMKPDGLNVANATVDKWEEEMIALESMYVK